jgi:transposase
MRVFVGRRGDRIKVLFRDRGGFVLYYKRLEKGRFRPSFSADGRLTSSAIEAAELALVVEGIELGGARRRPRWQPRSLAPTVP